MTASTIKKPTSLESLVAQINSTHAQFQQVYKTSLTLAYQIGELLVQAKTEVGHGNWLRWVEDNCTFSERTSQVYMKVFHRWDIISKSAETADLSIHRALEMLAPQTEVVDAELLEPEEEDNPQSPSPVKRSTPVKRSSLSSDGHSSSSSQDEQPSPKNLWPRCESSEFYVGCVCVVVDPEEQGLFGRQVEILKIYSDVVLLFKTLDDNERHCLIANQLRPMNRLTSDLIYRITSEIVLPQNLATKILNEITSQIELPQHMQFLVSKFE